MSKLQCSIDFIQHLVLSVGQTNCVHTQLLRHAGSRQKLADGCRDAILHVCHIHRVLMQPRGNALLVGVGGSGRKSLSRLATYVADQKCFSIEISKGYRITEFREDLKSLYRQVTRRLDSLPQLL